MSSDPEAPPPQTPDAPSPGAPAPTAAPARSPLRRWAFLALPAAALVELAAQGVIAARVPSPANWEAARAHIARARREGDLVTSAPLWTDPLARMHLHEFIGLRDAARPDATRYPRAWVATVRGGENPDLRGWREASSTSFGPLNLRLLVNPAPARVLYDFVDHLRPPDASAQRVDGAGAHECEFHEGLTVSGGGLGQGALAGPARFNCSPEGWNYVGVTVIEDMQHRGRRCIWSHPVQDGAMLTRFASVPIGTALHGHHGLAYEAERGDDLGNDLGGPVELQVLVDDQAVGTSMHHDGEGWKAFDFDTRRFAGASHTVTFRVRSERAGMRHYCFEGDTR